MIKFYLFFVMLFCIHPLNAANNTPALKTLIAETREFLIDGEIPKMAGPQQNVRVDNPAGKGGKIWITGVDIESIVDGKVTPLGKEFMCHSAVNTAYTEEDMRILKNQYRRGPTREAGHNFHDHNMVDMIGRTIVFSLGANQPSIVLPKGFGIRYDKDEIYFHVMVANIIKEKKPKKVKFRFKLYYVEDSPQVTLKPVRMLNFAASDDKVMEKDTNRRWDLAAGEERIVETDVTKVMNLKTDIKVVYIASHSHQGIQQFDLVDKTKDKSVYTSYFTHSSLEGEGDENVDSTSYSSENPLLFFKGHKYAVRSKSVNKYGKPLPMMTIVYLYYIDEAG